MPLVLRGSPVFSAPASPTAPSFRSSCRSFSWPPSRSHATAAPACPCSHNPRSMPPLPRSRTGGSGVFAGVFMPSRAFPAPSPGPRSDCIERSRAASAALSGASRFILPMPSSAAMRSPVAAWSWARSSAASSVTSSARSRARLISTQKALLGREMLVPRFHRRNHVVHGAALEGVHGPGPGMIEMAQLRIAPAEFERLAVLQAERHAPVRDPEHFRRAAVDQAQPCVVARPADAVAGAELDLLGAVDLAAALRPPTSSGFQATLPPFLSPALMST